MQIVAAYKDWYAVMIDDEDLKREGPILGLPEVRKLLSMNPHLYEHYRMEWKSWISQQ